MSSVKWWWRRGAIRAGRREWHRGRGSSPSARPGPRRRPPAPGRALPAGTRETPGAPTGLRPTGPRRRDRRRRRPGDVYEAQVALMEMSLERDAILAGLREARRAAATT